MPRKSFLLFLFVVLSTSVFSQYESTEDCKKAYKLIVDLRFDSAQIHIQKAKKKDAKNLMPLVLDNYIDFLRIVLAEDKNLFEQVRAEKKNRVSKWSQGSKESPYYRLGIAQMNMQWAFVRVMFGEYFTAAFEINQAYHLLEENKKLFPSFLPNNLGLGVLHAMIGVVPEKYQWAIRFLGLQGSIDQGLSELEALLNSEVSDYQIYKPEALFLFTFLKINLQSGDNRIEDLKKQYEKIDMSEALSTSPLLHFAYSSLLMREDNDAAIFFLNNRPQATDAMVFYYPDLMLAQAKLYTLDTCAYQLFDHYLAHYSGDNFKRSAAQKKAWSAFVLGDTLGYLQTMKKMLSYPKTKLDADDAAFKEAEKVALGMYLPNEDLLKGRLLFDGGYYKEALDIIGKADTNHYNSKEKIEWTYRIARIYHQMDALDFALKFYKQTLLLGGELNSYFAGNSCLKLGEIYERRMQADSAEFYYKKCVELNFTEYRRSVQAKAKVGLLRLRTNQGN